MRRSQLGQVLAMGTLLAVCRISCNSASQAAEVLRLSEKNWDDATPEGKEVDAIYGDWVLAQRTPGRGHRRGHRKPQRQHDRAQRGRLGHRPHPTCPAKRSAQRLLSVGHWLQTQRSS